jgi:hypothetical protein
MSPLALIVSFISLGVSITVAFFRQSIIKMTQPIIIAVGYTEPPHVLPNISLNTLLFAKPKWRLQPVVDGQVIESMYIKLSRNGMPQSFLVWYHGNERSGLFVDEKGVAAKHRFFTSKAERYFRFTEGNYKLEVFARLVGDDSPKSFFEPIELTISKDTAQEMEMATKPTSNNAAQSGVSFEFNWEPDRTKYSPPVREYPSSPFPGAPDYGEPASNLPGGENNFSNWSLYNNLQDQKLKAG